MHKYTSFNGLHIIHGNILCVGWQIFFLLILCKFFLCNFPKDLDLIWFTCENKTDTTCNCEDFRGCGLLISQQLQGWHSARWQQFKLHLANFNWFNDRSKLKGLDQSVAFDMKGHKL